MADTGFPDADAQADFARARRRARLSRAVSRLRRQPDDVTQVLPYDEVVAALGETGRRELRLRRVNPDTLRWEVRDGPDGAWRATTGAERDAWSYVAYEADADFAPDAVRVHEYFRRFISSVSSSGEINFGAAQAVTRTLPSLLRASRLRERLVDASGAEFGSFYSSYAVAPADAGFSVGYDGFSGTFDEARHISRVDGTVVQVQRDGEAE